jgi:hypothetical protein
MKRLVLTLLAATLVSGALAQNTSFPDIPANHWAADAVSRIANLGIVIGFPDGTFRGNEAFTRYQAALVISRLLDVVNQNVNSSLAMTKSDIESLRNAVQGLASDVASQGVRLSSAESAIASLSDDATANKSSIASNASRLDAVEQKLNNLPSGTDPAVLRDLQNQIASQRVAIDTAQAQADAAAKRANDAHDLAAQAMSQAQQNASDIAAANKVIQMLSDKVNNLPQPQAAAPAAPAVDLSGVQGDIQRNSSDIANIREFVILLRRDQVALRDRVSALESSDQQQTKDIASLQKRVTALESNPLGISGSIELKYFVGRTLGHPFDVDRAYGLGQTRSMGASIFSSGAAELTDDSPGGSGYQTGVGEVAQDRQDITAQAGDVSATLNLNISLGTSLNGAGSPNALNSFDAVLKLSLLKTGGLAITNPDGSTPYTGDGSATEGYVIHVDDFTTTFNGIGASPLTFSFGTNVTTTFTDYVVSTDEPGFVATLTSPDFLKFINPGLTVAYTAPDAVSVGNTGTTNSTYLRGAHLTLNPFKGITVGGSFAQTAVNANDKNNVNANNITDTVYGVDANASVSMFNLGFEWAQGSKTDQVTPANDVNNTLLYAKLNVDGKNIPILNSLDVNYRDIPQNWEVNGFNMAPNNNNDGNYPFLLTDGEGNPVGQTGYGVNASLGLFILDVSGYYDSYDFNVTTAPTHSVQAYGADVTAKLFAGFSLSGFFHSVTIDGTGVGDLADNYQANGAPLLPAMGDVSLNNNYDSGFGVTLKHDGSADNALIKGLNLEATYKQTGPEYGITTIDVKGDYTLNVSIVTLTPYAEYENISYGSNYTTNNDGTTTIQAGAGLSTTPLAVPLKPSLMGAVNYRTTDHTSQGGWNANELQWSVGLVLNQFLFDHSTLTGKYGSWSGQNIETATDVNGTTCYDSAGNTSTCANSASNISNGDVYNGATNSEQNTSGYEVIWNYYDLEFSYGSYQNHNTAGTPVDSSAQAFKITYTVNF